MRKEITFDVDLFTKALFRHDGIHACGPVIRREVDIPDEVKEVTAVFVDKEPSGTDFWELVEDPLYTNWHGRPMITVDGYYSAWCPRGRAVVNKAYRKGYRFVYLVY